MQYHVLYNLIPSKQTSLNRIMIMMMMTMMVALGLGYCKVRVKCSSEVYFSASLMIERHPVCTAFSSNFLTALMVVSEFSNNFTAALIFVLLHSALTDLRSLPPVFLEM